jgi:hypothetical protein
MNTKQIFQTSLMMTLLLISLFGCLVPMPAVAKPAPEPRPDLTILGAVYKEPNVIVKLKNAGDAPAPASVLAVQLLKRIDPDTNLPMAFQFPIPTLAAGQVIDRTLNIGNSSFTGNGALAVRVDFKKQVSESEERNNQKIVTLYQAPPLPDLVIIKVEIIKGAASVTVFNKCLGRADPTRLVVTIYKGNNNKSGFESSLSADVPSLTGNTGVKLVVDPMKYSTLTKSLTGRYIRVEVDDTNKLKETVDTNNWWETGAAPFPDSANSCDSPK